MRNYFIGFVLVGTLLLSGCTFGTSIEKSLSDALAEMNNAEDEYRDAQKELKSLEQSEQASFNEMMEFTQEHEEELKAKVSEVEQSLEKRIELINDEEASIQKAQEKISSFDKVIEKAEGNTKAEIEKLQEAVNDRYDLHANFVAEYKKLTELQKELYKKLVDEETQIVDLQALVDDVNEQNEIVKTTIDTFNEATITVNKLKDDIFSHLKEK